MPQLKSGRHVALSISPYLDALTAGSDESKYFAVLALRLSANSPQALRDQVVIGYFREGQGTPPDAPSYPSGYCVGDVLEGRSDWSPEEVAELRAFLDEPRIVRWLQEQWDEIDEAIRNSPVWRRARGSMRSSSHRRTRRCRSTAAMKWRLRRQPPRNTGSRPSRRTRARSRWPG